MDVNWKKICIIFLMKGIVISKGEQKNRFDYNNHVRDKSCDKQGSKINCFGHVLP